MADSPGSSNSRSSTGGGLAAQNLKIPNRRMSCNSDWRVLKAKESPLAIRPGRQQFFSWGACIFRKSVEVPIFDIPDPKAFDGLVYERDRAPRSVILQARVDRGVGTFQCVVGKKIRVIHAQEDSFCCQYWGDDFCPYLRPNSCLQRSVLSSSPSSRATARG